MGFPAGAESHWTLPYESLDFALSRFEGRAGRVNPGRFRTLPDLDEVPVALKRRVAGFDDLIYTCGYAQHVGRKPNVQAILEVSDAQLIPQPPFYSAGFAVEITLDLTTMPWFGPSQQERVDAAFAAKAARIAELQEAVLVRQQDEDTGDGPLQTHRVYRTQGGSYYLFICTAGEPGYLTRLTMERAENALRSSPEILKREFGRVRGGRNEV